MRISDILGQEQNTQQARKDVHSGEKFTLWQHLLLRYDLRELTDIFSNFAKDEDFKLILAKGLEILDTEIEHVENKMEELGIAFPPRPPKSVNTSANTGVFRDQLMFRIVYMGMQAFLTQHINALINTANDELRDLFIKLEKKEMNLYIKMQTYGQLKGWLFVPPDYNQS